MQRSFQLVYDAYEEFESEKQSSFVKLRVSTLDRYTCNTNDRNNNGFVRIEKCRRALQALDRRGYNRSFHQRLFHEDFIRACARIFWKTDPPGSFAQNHQKILESNGWDSLSQEVLISTPRRCVLSLPNGHVDCLHYKVFV